VLGGFSGTFRFSGGFWTRGILLAFLAGLGLVQARAVSSNHEGQARFVQVPAAPILTAKSSVIPTSILFQVARMASSDGIGGGWCGKATLSLLQRIGYGAGILGADGHDWEDSLWDAGWRPVFCRHPKNAPYGSVLVYWSDWKLEGVNTRGTKGGRFGHVEIVGWDPKGAQRVYVSDAPRSNYGGTVKDNFTGRAWLPPVFVSSYQRVLGRPLPFAGYRPSEDKLTAEDSTGIYRQVSVSTGQKRSPLGLGRGDAGPSSPMAPPPVEVGAQEWKDGRKSTLLSLRVAKAKQLVSGAPAERVPLP
jgi:hypothetical protein